MPASAQTRLTGRFSAGFHLFHHRLSLCLGAARLQPTVALSTAEAEYMGRLRQQRRDVVFLRQLLMDLDEPEAGATKMLTDNQAAIAIGNDHVTKPRTKHIRVRHHFVRELIADGTIVLQHCPGTQMVADALTKALDKQTFEQHLPRLGPRTRSRAQRGPRRTGARHDVADHDDDDDEGDGDDHGAHPSSSSSSLPSFATPSGGAQVASRASGLLDPRDPQVDAAIFAFLLGVLTGHPLRLAITDNRGRSGVLALRRLRERYIRSGKDHVSRLRQQLSSTTWLPTDTVDTFMSRITDINSQLLAAGTVTVIGKGDAVLCVTGTDGAPGTITLKNVLHVPDINYNILALKPGDSRASWVLPSSLLWTTAASSLPTWSVPLLPSKDTGHLFLYASTTTSQQATALAGELVHSSDGEAEDADEGASAHDVLGHRSSAAVDAIRQQIAQASSKHIVTCGPCALGKSTRASIPKQSAPRSAGPCQLLYADIAGPLEETSLRGARYALTFIDDCTRFAWTFLIRHKNDVGAALEQLRKDRHVVNALRGATLQTDSDAGYSRSTVVNYTDTFARRLPIAAIRTMLAMAVARGMGIQQMDVNTAFLNAPVDHEIYVQPPAVDGIFSPSTVLRLKRGLYGLKQSPRLWNHTLDAWMREQDFVATATDACIYRRTCKGGKVMWVAVYVDDLLIFADSDSDMAAFKKAISKRFKMKDLGSPDICLGIKVRHDRKARTVTMSQEHYLRNVLETFGMADCKPVGTPLCTGYVDKPADKEEPLPDVPFRELLGSLLYAATMTRPDISAAVSILSRRMQHFGMDHWKAAKHLLRYIKGTLSYTIKYAATGDASNGSTADGVLSAYSDASFASDVDTRRSRTGFVVFCSTGPVSWNSKLQATVATASADAEYMALAATAQELMFLRQLQEELTGAVLCEPTLVHTDNQPAQRVAEHAASHMRHILVKYHYIRECVDTKRIVLSYLATEHMIADLLTKILPRPKTAHVLCQAASHGPVLIRAGRHVLRLPRQDL
ncbi:hypothetical protein PTSG_12961 [Salpingoeca rosetta]|uniref:Integrase catalytic domain-containing protein n=1 Tax=Salpingoeca rosetta (strain ATCC 50818 / BSB-021) TaxID=946362 RepID=F2UNK7_SALR5|nr:uncharacterized protein PTSG_12961 [Salpingoeca rosetta]EGD79212.1 hypothetical protein PTSG_12961 [Salpingoeca rosetta]|eukprot:XP_004989297.1 hypothetical protein PTSG_12961 [Salpingoeca rosetta]